MTAALVSVVIPAYNVEERFVQTLESVLAQDYGPIEVIVVNDASTDRTSEIAHKVLASSKTSHFVIEHDRNKGVSEARNTGIKAAKGDFILFWDADDMGDSDFISILSNTIGENDIAICGYKSLDLDTGKVSYRPTIPNYTGLSAENIALMYIGGRFSAGVWSCLFRKSFLEKTGLRFHPGCIAGEDVEFVTKAMSRTNSIAHSPTHPYIYVCHRNMGSIKDTKTAEKKIARYISNTEAHFRMAEYLQEFSVHEKLKWVGKYQFLPEAYIRQLNIYTKQKDREKFERLAGSSEARKILLSGVRCFRSKPEVAFKSICLLLFPKLYFRLRS